MVLDDWAGATHDHHPSPPEANEDSSHSISVTEAGHRGGRVTREQYGIKHYQQIGKKGGKTLLEQRGPLFFSAIGTKGGKTRKQQGDPDFYSRIGRLGGSAPRRPTQGTVVGRMGAGLRWQCGLLRADRPRHSTPLGATDGGHLLRWMARRICS